MDCLQLLGAGFWWVLQIFTASLPIAIAWLAFRVAHQQKEISARQVRLALFEKRMTVFEDVANLILSDCFPEKFPTPSTTKLKHSAEFLFPDGTVLEFVAEIVQVHDDLFLWRGQKQIFERNDARFSKEIDEFDKKIHRALDQHTAKLKEAKSVFAEYLHVR